MSKYIKNLVSDAVGSCLDGVSDALLVNMIGLTSNQNNKLRTILAEKGIRVLVVKNSLVERACEGTPLEAMFSGVDGMNAVCWGGEDIVSLAKEVVKLQTSADFEAFKAHGGMMDGEQLSAAQVMDVSKWPSRDEQISIIVGQACGLGPKLSGQILSIGGALASQIEKKSEGAEDEPAADAPAEAEAEA